MTDYEVVATASDGTTWRDEVRRYPDKWVVVQLRPGSDGNWYLKKSWAVRP